MLVFGSDLKKIVSGVFLCPFLDNFLLTSCFVVTSDSEAGLEKRFYIKVFLY